jgi:anaerobic ribonucleoside-triphosphate reductase
MTENDKAELLKWLNKAVENYQRVIITEDLNKYFEIKSGWQEIVYKLIKMAESEGYKVIWEGYKAVKIVEKEEENDGKTKEKF